MTSFGNLGSTIGSNTFLTTKYKAESQVTFCNTFCGFATVFGFEISTGFFGRKISFFGTGTFGSRTSPTSDGVAFVVSVVGDVGVRGLREKKKEVSLNVNYTNSSVS